MSRSNPNSPLHEYLNTLDTVIWLGYESFNVYISLAERTTIKEIDDLSDKVKEWDKKNEGGEIQGTEVFQSDFYRVFHFDDLAINAGMILAYSELENGLATISNQYGSFKRKTNIGIVEAYKEYFTSKLKINFPDGFEEKWKNLSKWSLVRNRIVHNDSKLKETDVVEDFNKIIGVKLTPYNKIKFDDWNICRRFAKESETLLSFVISALMEKERVLK